MSSVLDTSERRRVYLFKGRNGAYIQLPEAAQFLLEQRERGASFEEIARLATERSGKPVSAAEAETAYQKVIKQIEAIESKLEQLPAGFWFKFTLIPAPLVAKIANALSGAYNPRLALGLLVLIGIALALTIFNYHALPKSGETFWVGFLLFQLSLIAHEFGHASACARYGAKPSDIGFTIYLIYPAFYSDVSAAWELRRWQRVVVDFGGMFFQLVVGAAYAIGYATTGYEPFFAANLLIATTIVFNLNPIFKFDGHWALADALGVTNLSQQPARLFKHLWQRLRGQPVQPLPWDARTTAALTVYAVLSFGAWIGFMVFMLPWAAERLAQLPELAIAAAQEALAQGIRRETLFSLFQSAYFGLLLLLMTSRWMLPLLRKAHRPATKRPQP